MGYHDIHQYYFERYLRNEMPAEDRSAFEEKLSGDEEMRKAFAYYKKNREKFLEELLIAEEKSKEQRKLNSWIYLLISVTGIILAVNFYLDNKELRSKNSTTIPFYKRIPFFFKNETKIENRPLRARVPIQNPEDTLGDTSVMNYPAEIDEPMEFNTDQPLKDTQLIAIEKAYYEKRYTALKLATDSLISDSLMERLVFKSALRNPGQSRPQNYLVEFWVSPIHYRGYLLNGKKIRVYGVEYPFQISLFSDNESVILRMTDAEVLLINDNEFHKF